MKHWRYIKIDKELEDDPRVMELAEIYAKLLHRELCSDHETKEISNALRSVTRNAIVGSLASLWRYADRNVGATNALRISVAQLAEKMRVPVELLRQFPEAWILVKGDFDITLPAYIEKNNIIPRENIRKSGAARQQRFRDRLRQEQHVAPESQSEKSVTPPTPSVTPLQSRHITRYPLTGHARRARGRPLRPSESEETSQPFFEPPRLPDTAPAGYAPLPKLNADPPPSPRPEAVSTAASPAANTKPRQTSPRKGSKASGTNPRALGTNKRVAQMSSNAAWLLATQAVDKVRATNSASTWTGRPPASWTDAARDIGPESDAVVKQIGGYKKLADRDRYTSGELKRHFRLLFEAAAKRASELSSEVPPT